MNKLINNEKHYVTLSNYLKDIYHKKVYKITLNGNFTCPNRDGKLSYNGCIYCSSKGSGDFAGNINDSIVEQFNNQISIMEKKWPDGYYIAYFQANTNTYDTVENLKKRFDLIIDKNNKLLNDKIKILSIATRPDCLSDEILKYLSELSNRITLWVELGFQTSNELTAKYINRGYSNNVLDDAVKKLHHLNINVIVHIINGLPNETYHDMINTIKYVCNLPIDGIKIHMLHILKDSTLANIYNTKPFNLLTLNEYVEIVADQLRYIPDNIVIHRITGDPDINNLIAPNWVLKKFVVIDEIDKYLRKNNYYQGDLTINLK